MATTPNTWWTLPSRILHSWYTPAVLILLLLVTVLIWAMPRRIDQVSSADTDLVWPTSDAPPVRKVLWEPAQPVAGLLPDSGPDDSFVTPRLTDAGATLYFTRRTKDGHADIYRARLEFGRWQPAEPVAELNSDSEDFCSSLSADGRTIYLYSNRDGGHGGFDIYVSYRGDTSWSEPQNLGPGINTPLDEYDPAVTPDGLTLIFASDRTPELLELLKKKEKELARHLRTHSGLRQFDLYLCRKTSIEKPWTVPEPVAELNTATGNEGAPYFSPFGSYLYFASDRPNPHGDARNKDLYRARFTGGKFHNLENLGPGVNTASNELEPGLSPEGYTLIFSSDRDGTYKIYTSKAQEVIAGSQWDTSRWNIVASLWWKVLGVLLSLGLLAFLLWYYHPWLFEKATASRFLVASLLLHLILVCILALIPVASEVIDQVQTVEAKLSLVEVYSSVNAGGLPAHATVTDLPGIEQAVGPEVFRQTITPAEIVPEKTINPANLDVPVHVVRIPLPDAAPAVPEIQPPQSLPSPTMQKLVRLDPSQIAKARPLEIEPVPVVENPMPQLVDAGTVDVGRKTTQNDPDTKQPPPNPVPNPEPDAGPQVKLRPVTGNPAPQKESLQVPLPTRKEAKEVLALAKLNPSQIDLTPVNQPVPAKTLDPLGAAVGVDKQDSGKPDPAKPMSVNPRTAPPELGPITRPDLESRPEKTDTPAMSPPKTLLPKKASPALAKLEVDLPKFDPGNFSPDKVTGVQESPLAGPVVALPKTARPTPDPTNLSVPDLKKTEKPGIEPAPVGMVPKKPLADKPALVFGNSANDPLPRKLAKGAKLALLDPEITARLSLAARDPETKREAAQMFGGSKESEEAVERGLKWLAKIQNKDGSWSLSKHQGTQADTAGTALAVLPFLGAGYTHKKGKYQDTLDRALRFLVKHQRPNGDLFKPENPHHHMYSHGLAAIVLCEAYAMTFDPALRDPAQKALDFIAASQAPGGGWRYVPNQADGDTSVFGWQVMALKSGQMAGLEVSPATIDGALRFLKSVEGKGNNFGTFDYQPGTQRISMTAQGLLSLQLLGASRDDPRLLAGAEHLLKNLPRPGQQTSYYYYHANQVMYHLQGKYWQAWNEKLRDMNIKEQVKNGANEGSWDPRDDRERTGGRIFATSLRLLMLEVYYRHLPLYKQLAQ